ncbi:hypothetical protein Ancab_011169 [Ancistrocladus abbreviatus]
MTFKRGELVEICGKDEGFEGSYYPATIISKVSTNSFIVQYNTLLKDDESAPLREIIYATEIRPTPPDVDVTEFKVADQVEAWANDGWWLGKVKDRYGRGRANLDYCVYFENSREEAWFHASELRVHQEWVNGKWVDCCKKEDDERSSGRLIGGGGLDAPLLLEFPSTSMRRERQRRRRKRF